MNIKICDLNKSYNKNVVLKDINLSLNSGEVVGLVGENGAGKSTLMKIISGLVKEESGSVTFNNMSIYNDRIEYLKNISAIIEEPALYYDMSGLEHIKFIANLNKVSLDKVNEIKDFINIGQALKRRTSTYSMGMKQRVVLGLALLKEPKFLILDEPTNGLDMQSALELRKNILYLAKKKNITILISSHILSEIEKICDRVIFIKNGEIVNDNFKLKENKIKNINLSVLDRLEFINYISKCKYIINYEEENDNFKISIESNLVKTFMNEITLSKIEYTNISISEVSLEDTYFAMKGEV